MAHGDDSPAGIARRAVDQAETRTAQRSWWDRNALDYQAAHATDLGAATFLWCPEGVLEADARLLGEVMGRRVLEVGCGAAQCARWLLGRGARVVGIDLSERQLAQSARYDAETGAVVPVAQADALALPFADAVFDVVFSAYGALPFVVDGGALMSEVARVLRSGGRWVFSVGHPVRWCFPDDPGQRGLTVVASYFDRRPYVETDGTGRATYVEHHATLGDRVSQVVGAGLRVIDLIEPEWPAGHESSYPQWSATRGQLIPGTTIWVTEKD
ncbi:MAG TPA: class I SAM-dependent methyltransferase [Mycobacteriales bacterium]|nr:class I SAM-dependent methyltransferase [Mycobacteriales bacterium]